MNDNILLLMMGGVAFVTVLSLAFAFAGDDKGAKRVSRVSERARGGGAPIMETALRLDQRKQSGLDSMMRRLVPQPDLLRQRLARTGRPISLGAYGIICGVSVTVCMALPVFFGLPPLYGIPAGAIIGLMLPHLVVGFMANRRSNRFTALLPDAIGLMVRGIKSGLPVGETMVIVGQEIRGPVGEEFRRVSDEVRLGQQLDKALWEAAKRVDTPEIKFLVVSLSVQKETGGNLAETLENLDNILRRRRQMKLKVKAMSSEARASAGIIGSLPFVMLALISAVNPTYIGELFHTHLGNEMLGAGAFSMSLGIFIMQKMAKFDI